MARTCVLVVGLVCGSMLLVGCAAPRSTHSPPGVLRSTPESLTPVRSATRPSIGGLGWAGGFPGPVASESPTAAAEAVATSTDSIVRVLDSDGAVTDGRADVLLRGSSVRVVDVTQYAVVSTAGEAPLAVMPIPVYSVTAKYDGGLFGFDLWKRGSGWRYSLASNADDWLRARMVVEEARKKGSVLRLRVDYQPTARIDWAVSVDSSPVACPAWLQPGYEYEVAGSELTLTRTVDWGKALNLLARQQHEGPPS